jgi:hypothetical protein
MTIPRGTRPTRLGVSFRLSLCLLVGGAVAGAACSGDDAPRDTEAGGASGAPQAAGGAGAAGAPGGGQSGDGATPAAGANGDAGLGGGATGGASSGEAGMGGGAPAESFLPLYASGSRLRAITVGEAGSSERRLVAFFDTELEAECRFRYAEDGEYRCLPLARNLSEGFATAACDEPVLYDGLAQPCAESPPFVVTPVDGAACGEASVARLEPRPLDTVYDPTCSAPIELPSGALVYERGPALAPTTFVRAERVRNLADAGFGVDELRGEDGSRQVLGPATRELGFCTAREVRDGGLRCVPQRAYLDGDWFFADAACSETPLAYAVRSESCAGMDPAALALVWRDAGYAEPPEVMAIGAPMPGTVYELSGTECTERDAGDLIWDVHELEGAFDVERLLAIEEVHAPGAGTSVLYHAHAGVRLSAKPGDSGAVTFNDGNLDVECEVMRGPGDVLYCLPPDLPDRSGAKPMYSDSTCERPVLLASVAANPIFVATRSDFCGREEFSTRLASDFYSVGPEASGDIYELADDGSCSLASTESYRTLELVEVDYPRLVESTE